MAGRELEIFLGLGVLIPLVSFTFLAFFGSKLGKPVSGWVATAAIGSSAVLATLVLVRWLGMSDEARVVASQAAIDGRVLWATLGTVDIDFGVNLDSLTIIMFFMVSFIATWIHVFSVGYMAGHSDEVDGQSKYHRFFTYLSLFCFSMLGLLIAANILFLFFFWELVGLCSYLLIGFYFDKKFASNAAMKAFITNRVGDFGFIIGLALVLAFLGDSSLNGSAAVFEAAAHEAGELHGEMGSLAQGIQEADPAQVSHATQLFTKEFLGINLATWMGFCLFCGAMGKSAQVPLQVWLPDAMAGPTPVSALIHAATMVAAGVYLVARIYLLLTPQAQLFIATIGCITLTMAALIAIVQTDIKKVLAYSTLSQLGYMIFGLGVGAWTAAIFHLLTHAFFKSMLFLGSGQVIEGCHHEQEITKMGGLRKKMPVTCWTFFVGVLAISGFGIPGTQLGIGGFFSKDEILAVAYYRTHPAAEGHGDGHEGEHQAGWFGPARAQAEEAGHETGHDAAGHEEGGHADAHGGEHGGSDVSPAVAAASNNLADYPWLFWLPIIIAYVTPFYMMRVWWLTFMGEPRDQHVYEHAHESKLMFIPLVVLSAGTLWASYFVCRDLVFGSDPGVGALLVPTIDGSGHFAPMHSVHEALVWIVGPAYAVGFVLAFLIYRNGLALPARLAVAFWPIHRTLQHKFFFDEVYNTFLVGGTRVVAGMSRLFDTYIVDGLVNLAGWTTKQSSMLSGLVLDARGVVHHVFEGNKDKTITFLIFIIFTAVALTGLAGIIEGAGVLVAYAVVAIWVLLGVDGFVNDIAAAAWRVAGWSRSGQDGRIRHYVMFATAGAVAVILAIMFWDSVFASSVSEQVSAIQDAHEG